MEDVGYVFIIILGIVFIIFFPYLLSLIAGLSGKSYKIKGAFGTDYGTIKPMTPDEVQESLSKIGKRIASIGKSKYQILFDKIESTLIKSPKYTYKYSILLKIRNEYEIVNKKLKSSNSKDKKEEESEFSVLKNLLYEYERLIDSSSINCFKEFVESKISRTVNQIVLLDKLGLENLIPFCEIYTDIEKSYYANKLNNEERNKLFEYIKTSYFKE